MIVTDENYKILGKMYEECHTGTERFIPTVFKNEQDMWPSEAEKVHGITWKKSQESQHPLDLCRKIYKFLEQFDSKLKMVFHNSQGFDTKFLMGHFILWSETGYYAVQKYLNWRFYDDTQGMARDYIRNGSDALKKANKLQKQVDKYRDLLTKDRKTPATPAKMQEWNEKLSIAENELVLLEVNSVQFSGVSLDKICKALDIPLKHHNALSDTEALIPIHKFLTENS
jgi:DNA polymerase III epsilon subunit-like protein